MVFSSFVFLLLFLPVVLFLYQICPAKGRNLLLLFASVIFYSWGEPKFVIWLAISASANYCIGQILGRKSGKVRQVILISSVIGNLGILAVFKYGDFLSYLPIGLSFYTFQVISYLLDVYRKDVRPQKNYIHFMTYLLMFPQLVAGPIIRYKSIEKELSSRKYSYEDLAEGGWLFVVGLSQKVLLANQLGIVWEQFLQLQNPSMFGCWIGIACFSLQIYFDFSGYSHMAIGLGRMFGFHFEHNFYFPYASKSICEFWRRWHISLGKWFQDYIYIPLGGSRQGVWKMARNILMIWLLTGLWHGSGWNFILWGIYFGIFVLVEKLFLGRLLEKLPSFLRHLYCLMFVAIGWSFFAIEDWSTWVYYIKHMFLATDGLVDATSVYLAGNHMVLMLIAILCAIPWKDIASYLAEWKPANPFVMQVVKTGIMLLLLFVNFIYLAGASYNPFLYFRF